MGISVGVLALSWWIESVSKGTKRPIRRGYLTAGTRRRPRGGQLRAICARIIQVGTASVSGLETFLADFSPYGSNQAFSLFFNLDEHDVSTSGTERNRLDRRYRRPHRKGAHRRQRQDRANPEGHQPGPDSRAQRDDRGGARRRLRARLCDRRAG